MLEASIFEQKCTVLEQKKVLEWLLGCIQMHMHDYRHMYKWKTWISIPLKDIVRWLGEARELENSSSKRVHTRDIKPTLENGKHDPP